MCPSLLASFSKFSILPSNIQNIFRLSNKIQNIVIPSFIHKYSYFRFAFIRFLEVVSQKMAIKGMDGIKLGGRTLMVQPTNFDSPIRHPLPQWKPDIPNQPSHKNPHQSKPIFQPKSSLRDHRSYRDVSSPTKSPILENQPKSDINQHPPLGMELKNTITG